MTFTIGGQYEIPTELAVSSLLNYPQTTIRFFDLGPVSPPNAVMPTDIGRLIVIEPLQQRVAVGLLLAEESAPWGLVGDEERLEDAAPGGELYARADRLFRHFDDVPGVSYAIASKLLHIKRPRFFPLLDAVLRKVYDYDAASEYTDTTGRPAGRRRGRLFWAAVRTDLIDPRNVQTLRSVRDRLSDIGGRQAEQLVRLENLRLFDMLAWMAGTGRLATR
ncbi:MAG TPA: DUF6308 family protein [Acidimicrobiales bacterium]|jgi:hypothetical protein|nr:DUF6308 family protein [Acidimicrobiales bacterium]